MQAGPSYSEADGVGAIRLAVEAAADSRALRRVLRAVLERVPETRPANTRSVELLVEAVQAANVEFRVTDQEPRGRLTKPGRKGARR